ncbi:MAG: zinc ribbon domain-containing protein [Halorhabdus sp.]
MTETASAKRPWVAIALSIVFPGLGHAYLREWLRTGLWLALLFAAAWLVIPPDLIPQETSYEAIMQASRNLPQNAAFLILGLRVLNVIDAYVLARQRNRDEAVASGRQCPECGHDLDDEDLAFCPWCGTDLEAVEADETDSRPGL